MDFATLSNEVSNFLVPYLPYLAMAGKSAIEEVGKKTTEAGFAVAKSIWAKLRHKVEASPAALEAAQDAAQALDDPDAQAAFRLQIKKLLAEDSMLAGKISADWQQAHVQGLVISHSAVTAAHDANAAARDIVYNTYYGTSGPVPQSNLTPHQLPPPPSDFTGRQDDIDELLGEIRKGGANISSKVAGLRGMGGVGKTALALKLAEILTPEYPDGQLFLNLKGIAEQPIPAPEAMAHVIRGYFPEMKLPDNLNDLANLYRSVLHGKKVILLMDNAGTRDQAEPLIPPPGSVLIVTSRERFAVPGLYPRNLDTLPPDDSYNLLLRIESRIDGFAREIARLCGYLPLALRAAASLLQVTPDLDPADYTEALLDERHRLGIIGKEGVDIDVEASFNLSYERLSRYAQGVFTKLSIFYGSFDAKAEDYVCEDAGHSILSDLVKRSLVEWDEKSKRYNLHELSRLFAIDCFDEEGAGKARLRHARYYRDVLSDVAKLYGNGGESIIRALGIFDAEWPNFKSGQAWAAAHIADSKAIAALCSSYPSAGADIINLRLSPREEIVWREKALSAARLHDDITAESIHLGNLAHNYSDIGDVKRSLSLHEQAINLYRQRGDRFNEAISLGKLGSTYAKLGDINKAIELYNKALDMAQKMHDQRGEAIILGNLGAANTHLGEINQAIGFYQKALDTYHQLEDRYGEAIFLGNLGSIYRMLGEIRRAIGFHEQALGISYYLKDRRNEANNLVGLGLDYHDLGELCQAMEFYKRALVIARQLGDRHREAERLCCLGLAYIDSGEFDTAVKLHREALAISTDMDDKRQIGLNMGNLGLIYKEQGKQAYAIEHYEKALIIAQEMSDKLAEACWLGRIGSAKVALGEIEQSFKYFEDSLAIARYSGYKQIEGFALYEKALALDQLGRREEAIASAQAALAIYQKMEYKDLPKVRAKLEEWNALPPT